MCVHVCVKTRTAAAKFELVKVCVLSISLPLFLVSLFTFSPFVLFLCVAYASFTLLALYEVPAGGVKEEAGSE